MTDLAIVPKPEPEATPEPSVPLTAIEAALADYQRQLDEWIAKRNEATRQIDATDGAMQACRALLRGAKGGA